MNARENRPMLQSEMAAVRRPCDSDVSLRCYLGRQTFFPLPFTRGSISPWGYIRVLARIFLHLVPYPSSLQSLHPFSAWTWTVLTSFSGFLSDSLCQTKHLHGRYSNAEQTRWVLRVAHRIPGEEQHQEEA